MKHKTINPQRDSERGEKVINPTNIPCTPSSLNVQLLEELLRSHPDRQFVAYLIEGSRLGFDTGIKYLPCNNYICKNLLSARRQPKLSLTKDF